MTIYRSVRIPEDLIQTVQKVVSGNKELGYRTHSEFVIDAVRRRVEDLITNNDNSSKDTKK